MSSLSQAAKNRWKKIPLAERSKIMSQRALKGIAKKTPEQLRQHALLMVKAKNKK